MLKWLIDKLNSRTILFAIYFTLMGTALEWAHRLSPEFVAMIGAIQALVLAHSYKEDHFDKCKDGDAK